MIATYNWSSVLRYAIQSVLWQTFRDFELLIIGDGCTDDSEQVVKSFRDRRIHWHNLPENSGSQSTPNNTGIELARGTYVAYLGHDDLWYPTHLAALSNAIQAANGDLAYTIAELIVLPPQNYRVLSGVSPHQRYDPTAHIVPSTLMHRRALIGEIGGWKDYRLIRASPDYEFVARAELAGKRFVPVNELTVFKIPSAPRHNVYRERPSGEQAQLIRRIRREPEFRYHELMQTIVSMAALHPQITLWSNLGGQTKPGSIIEAVRSHRGLAPNTPLAAELTESVLPLHADLLTLRILNRKDDLGPLAARQALHSALALPPDGLYLGGGWHGWERDEWGMAYRWAMNDPEIVITAPTGEHQRLEIDVEPGPGVGYGAFELQCFDEQNRNIVSALILARERFQVTLALSAGQGTLIRLSTGMAGHKIEPDSLTFRIIAFGWCD